MNVAWKLSLSALLLASSAAFAAPRPLIADKSRIEFSVKQMGVAVSGQFKRFTATIDLDPAKPEASSAEVTVDTASLTTGDADADQIAVDKPWLAAAQFPKAVFKSTAVKATAKDRFEVKGTLTLRGTARPLTVPLSTQTQADGSTVVSGEFSLKRADFNIGGGEWNEADIVGAEVPVKFRLTLAPAK